MGCINTHECSCPKVKCSNHGKCCDCIVKHKKLDGLPFCLFPDNDGDKSNKNYYRKLKNRFATAAE